MIIATEKDSRIVTQQYLPRQGDFLRICDTVNYGAYIGGFGSGKTHILAVQSLRAATRSTKPSLGLIGAPTYKMLEDTTQRKFFEICPRGWVAKYNRSKNYVTLIDGSEILFRSLENPGRLAGLELAWWGLDEIGEVKLETFNMLQGRLKWAGKGFGVGNPAGPAHWTYDYFVEKALLHPNDYRLVQATTYENTFLPRRYTHDMEVSFGVNTPYYRQYVLGQFVAFEGSYWPNFNPAPYPQGHVVSPENALAPLEGTPHFGKVVDFGFEHPLAILWFVTDGQTIVFFDEYWQKHGLIRWHCLQVKEKEAAHQKWYGPHIYHPAWTDHEAVSRAEFEHCVNDAGDEIGFTCVPVEKKVMEGILLVQSLFGEQRLFIASNCKQTLREVPSYRSQTGVMGEEPIRENEDTCACLRYACWAELNHTLPWKRYDSGSSVPDDILDHEKSDFEAAKVGEVVC